MAAVSPLDVDISPGITHVLDNECPDDILSSEQTVVMDSVTYNLVTSMADQFDYYAIRAAVESCIFMVDKRVSKHNLGKEVSKVAKEALKLLLQRMGWDDVRPSEIVDLELNNEPEWRQVMVRDSRKRRLSGGYGMISSTKRPNTQMSNGFNTPVVMRWSLKPNTHDLGFLERGDLKSQFNDESTGETSGRSSAMSTNPASSISDYPPILMTQISQPESVPSWPIGGYSPVVVEPIDQVFLGFCLRKHVDFITAESLDIINPTHLVMFFENEKAKDELRGGPVKLDSPLHPGYTDVDKSVQVMTIYDKVNEQDNWDIELQLKDAIKFIHKAKVENKNNVIAVCCDTIHYSRSTLLVVAYLQAYLNVLFQFGLRSLTGFNPSIANMSTDEVERFRSFLLNMGPDFLLQLEDKVGAIDDSVREDDMDIYLNGIRHFDKWRAACREDQTCPAELQSWNSLMDFLCDIDLESPIIRNSKPAQSEKLVVEKLVGFHQASLDCELGRYNKVHPDGEENEEYSDYMQSIFFIAQDF